MAAKQLQGKKKVKTGKRKQLQKNHRQVRQKQRKLQPHKKKKTWSRSRHAHKAKVASTGRLKTCSSKRFASKILRQMPKVRMEAKARGLVKTLLAGLYNQVVTEVKSLIQRSETPNISCTDVQTALNDAMAKLLAKHTAKLTGGGTTTTTTAAAASSQCA